LAGGFLASLLIAPVCFYISHVIFVNFVDYAKKFMDPEKQSEQMLKVAKWREQRSGSNRKGVLSSKKKSSAKKK